MSGIIRDMKSSAPKAPAPRTPKPKIASLGEYLPEDMQNALMAMVWDAREWLSDLSRLEAPMQEQVKDCHGVTRLLGGALALIERMNASNDERVLRATELLRRAEEAAKAAASNGYLAASYAQAVESKQTGLHVDQTWDQHRVEKAGQIFRRAIEGARQETHRALSELCEIFPESMAVSDDEEE